MVCFKGISIKLTGSRAKIPTEVTLLLYPAPVFSYDSVHMQYKVRHVEGGEE
jgi:hypothetical protein